ncbi:glycosyltransferase family 2 protein [Mycobacterium sp.]|uniref:glycosyltransferase family 2 protein n=1 Tax=Mycobacterium sp. TaxID=1785 RepID=UPI003BB035EB
MTTVSATGHGSDNGSALHLATTIPPDPSSIAHIDTGAGPAVRPRVSLVIPVRNEARNIASVLEQIADDVDEIILVDGNSTDVTLTTAQAYRPDLRIVPQEGVGKGSALRTGFQAATGDIIVMMDADGSMSPQEIRHYVHFLNHGYDFVKGSRFISGGGSLDITWIRRLGNLFLLTAFNTVYDAQLTDLCYGFCAFHRRYLEHLRLSATGFEIEAEMTVRAMQTGLRIAEVPSLELPRRTGASNLHAIRDGIRVLRTVLRHHRSGVSGHLYQAARQATGRGPAVSAGATA